MLWEMRANLIRKLGPEAGNNLALQLVTDGLKLSPPNPNFVQARDAILLAERMWSGGTNSAEIWSAFAKRGLGFNAKAPESYTTSGAQESHDLMPALAVEQVEIQGTNAVQLGVNNSLLIHVRNQGDATATHVSGQLATAVPGVTVLQGVSTYSDIPQGGSGANAAVFQIQTGTGFVEGTPIDLAFVITSDQSAGTSYLSLFTGVPGAEILFDNYSAMADTSAAASGPRDLTPWDIEKAEPLWMSDDVRCLLKLGTSRYALWTPDGNSYLIDNTNFLADRLTRQGVVVGTLTATNTFDELSNKIPHSVGAYWFFPLNQPVPLTRDEYRWPAIAEPLSPAGKAYSLTNLINGQPRFLTNVTSYPTLHDLWDINSNGVADRERGGQKMERLRVIDWEQPANNDFLLVSQLSVTGALYTCRPDLVGFVNGLPLVVLELKEPGVPGRAAFDENLTHYKQQSRLCSDISRTRRWRLQPSSLLARLPMIARCHEIAIEFNF